MYSAKIEARVKGKVRVKPKEYEDDDTEEEEVGSDEEEDEGPVYGGGGGKGGGGKGGGGKGKGGGGGGMGNGGITQPRRPSHGKGKDMSNFPDEEDEVEAEEKGPKPIKMKIEKNIGGSKLIHLKKTE